MNYRSDKGFSLPELMVSVAIVLVVVLGFAGLLTAITHTASTAQQQREITRLLDSEHKALAGVAFDNLMASTGVAAVCDLGAGRISTQSVGTSPTTHIVENTPITLTRNVVWASTGDPVICVEGFSTRDDDKKVTITATWTVGNTVREQTSEILHSRFLATPVDTRLTAPAETITHFISVDSAAGWCPSSTVEVDDTDDVNLSFRFTDLTELTCGYTVTGLTPGATYTAVMYVQVPVGATATISNSDNFTGTIAVGDGQMQYISLTFMAFSTSSEIRIGVQSDVDMGLQPMVKLFDFRLYG